eukprot:scaffold6691_cov358-Prasinococcus_capsulatus_cf.AAC.13
MLQALPMMPRLSLYPTYRRMWLHEIYTDTTRGCQGATGGTGVRRGPRTPFAPPFGRQNGARGARKWAGGRAPSPPACKPGTNRRAPQARAARGPIKRPKGRTFWTFLAPFWGPEALSESTANPGAGGKPGAAGVRGRGAPEGP